jgi:glycosyltransferase involved in cell wall biosynthesis
MQVLFVLPTPPVPPQSGLALRAYGLLRGLAETSTGTDLTLDVLCFRDAAAPPSREPVPFIRRMHTVVAPAWRKPQRIRALATSDLPDLAHRLDCPDMREQFTAMLRETHYDAVIYMGLEMAIYMAAGKRTAPQTVHIYDAQNVEHLLQRQMAEIDRRAFSRLPASWYSSVQSRRILAVERRVVAEADAVTAVSAQDAEQLARFRADRQVTVIENGIFVGDYSGVEPSIELQGEPLVFTGKMDYRPNVDAIHWFSSDILPRIQSRRPQARLYAVGQKPHPSLLAYSSHADIEITGWVPSVVPFLFAADVYVAPLRIGSGTRLKLLEACAAGCAIVSTPIGAEGLAGELLDSLRLGDTDASFADQTVDLLNHPDERRRLGAAAQERVRMTYDWSVVAPRLNSLLQSVTGTRGH